MSISADRLTLMNTFVRICERSSISAAARDLGMTQATASRQLASLEQRLGALLIERNTHAMTITPTGRMVLDEARTMLSNWEGLAERLGRERDALEGPIKMVLPIAMGRAFLNAAVSAFLEDHPGVTLHAILDDEPQSAAQTGYDLLVKIGPPSDETLVVSQIATITRFPVANPGLAASLPQSPSDLASLDFVALAPFEGGRIPLKSAAGKTDTITPTPRMLTNDVFAVRDAVLSGVGWAVLPEWLVRDELSAGRLVPLLPDWEGPNLPVTIAFQPSRRTIARVRALGDTIALCVQERLQSQ